MHSMKQGPAAPPNIECGMATWQMQGLVPCWRSGNLRRWGRKQGKSSARIVLSADQIWWAALGCADLPARRRGAHGQAF
jgi:hypothetical protein